jgi:hypothetical protein
MTGAADTSAIRLKMPAAGFRRGLKSCDIEFMQVICPTGQDLFENNPGRPDSRRQTTAGADPLASPLNKPRLHRVVAVEPAQFVIKRRRRKLRGIARIEARQRSEPAEETA